MQNQPNQPQNPYSSGRSPFTDKPSGSPESPKQSGLGIASFIVAVALGLASFGIIVSIGILASAPGGVDPESPVTMALGLGMFAIVGLSLIGSGLGIAGLFQKNRKRIFAILGLIFNLLVVLGFAGLFVLGLVAQASVQ